MRPSHRLLTSAVCAALAACSGCAAARPSTDSSPRINELLNRQADAWNRGDLRAFMQPYWNSPELTFSSGGKTTRGWQATYDRYVRKYPTRDEMGALTFSDLEVREVAPRAALVLGRWHLERRDPIGGNFSLVLRRDGEDWVIIHDHTSVDAP